MTDQLNRDAPRLSAAHLTVPRKHKAEVPAKLSFIERLRVLVAEAGSNKNDMAIVAITACIGEGVNTATAIYVTLARLDFKTSHIAMMLKSNTGTSPAAHRWSRDANGRFHLLE